MTRPYVRFMSVLIEAGQKNAVKPAEIAARIAERDDRHSNRWRDENETRTSLPTGHRKSIEGGESISARTATAGFQLLPVTGNNHFSLITFEHNAQPQSDCEHLEFSVSRGPGKLQRLFWQMLLDHGRPMTFAEIRGRARVGYAREGRARRALQGLMNHGVVIATGSGGKGHPYHYSVNPLISVDINRNGNGS